MTSDFFSGLSTMPKDQLVGLIRDNLSTLVGTLPGVLRVLAGQTDSGDENALMRVIPLLIEISPQVFNKEFRQQTERVFSDLGGQLTNAVGNPQFYSQILTILQQSRNSENPLPIETVERISGFMASISHALQSSDRSAMNHLRDQLIVVIPDLMRVLETMKAADEERS